MSNDQWNQPQGGEWPKQQPEGTPAQGQPATEGAQQEWGQARREWGQQQDWTQQGQTSASEWGQPAGQQSAPGNDWTQQQPAAGDWQQAQAQPSAGDWQQAQPQQSAGDWHQAQPQQSAGDWHQAQAQPQQSAGDWQQGQPHAGQEWGQPQGSAQEWGQQQWPAQQGGWDQNQQWGQQGQVPGGAAPAGAPQQWTPQPKKPSPFDFSFKQLSLPDAAGTIFLIGTIGIGVWWLFELIRGFTLLVLNPMGFFTSALGGAGIALFAIMVLRVLLEIGVAVTRKPEVEEAKADEVAVEDPTPEA